MNKKKIISTTIMFIVTTAAVILFAAIFGGENILVGVAGITAVLYLLDRNYTLRPIKNTIYFVVFELSIGLATFIGSLNPFLALITTFSAIFYILYNFTYNTKKPIYLPFILAFIYMFYTPVTIDKLPLRLISLTFCGLAIMVLQLLVNSNKLKKQSTSQLNIALESINKQIKLLNSKELEEKYKLNKDTDKTLNSLIEAFTYAIDQNKSKLSIELLRYLSIAQFLNSLNIILNKYEDFTIPEKLLNLLDNINLYINDKANLDCILDSISDYDSMNLGNNKNTLNIALYPYTSKLKRDLKQNNIDKITSGYSRSDFLREFSFKNNVIRKSVRFTFAFRGALIISLAVFIISLFDINNGKWIVFSLSAINQPYLDNANAKLRDRIIGTTLGLIIFMVTYSIVTADTPRMLLLLIVGYAMNYITKYRYSVICVTLFALGSISIGANIGYITVQRFIFVIIGSFIAIVANRIILPTYAYKATQSAIDKSTSTNEEIVSLLSKKHVSLETFEKSVQPLVVRNKWLNKYIAYNNSMLLSNKVDDYVYNQDIFLNDIIGFQSLLYSVSEDVYDKAKLDNNIDYINNNDLSNEDIFKSIEMKYSGFDKVVLNNFISIKQDLSLSKKLRNRAISSINR